MAELATDSTQTPQEKRGRYRAWFQNPVTVRELRSRMRGRRAFAVLTLYLVALGSLVTLVYLAYVSDSDTVGGGAARTAGKGLFATVVGVQVFLVLFIGPAFTSGAISGERERQTYDLLRTTLLSAEAFVFGKLSSALSYVILLVLASIPIQSIAFLLGGLSFVELLISQLLILVAAVTYALFGLWCSATLRTTLAATVTTFATVLFITFGLPLLVFIGLLVFAPISGTVFSFGPITEALIYYTGLVLAALNLPATLIVSEALYLNQNAVLGFTHFIGTLRIWLFSPWPLFILFHIAAAVLIFQATVRRVKRVSDD